MIAVVTAGANTDAPTYMGDLLTWTAADNLFRLTGCKVESQVVNGRQSASWGRPLRDLFLSSGGWVFRVEPNPGWWNVTQAEAHAAVGLPPP